MKFPRSFLLLALCAGFGLPGPNPAEARRHKPIRSALDTPLVSAGSVWRYLDNGSNQGTAWRAPAFDDSSWASGPAQLGYGDGDESTVVSFGPNSASKFVTTYFRRAFNVADLSQVEALELRLLADDGAVVYLNGVEIARTNLAVNPVLYDTLATGQPANESAFLTFTLLPTQLRQGANVLAVEVHQVSRTSSDISFDLALFARPLQASLTRGPYLQLGTSNRITIRWRTSLPTDSRVRFGTVEGNLTQVVDEAASVTDHEITLTGLTPNTLYYYSIGTTAGAVLDSGSTCHFTTAPPPGTVQPVRIWALGDSGRTGAGQNAVRDSFLALQGNARLDLWLMMGDNAYETGTDAEYQTNLFDIYGSLLKTSPLWSTLGNHETAQSTVFTDNYPYFDIFTLPTAAEAGGVASGTEHYYSFDYANVHFICLDSMTADRTANGAQANWLRADLAQTTAEWIIAFWHHPPYSKGSHNSDTEGPMIEMRQVFNPILEAGGVDLLLFGHSHAYERSYLLDGHYGSSSTLTPAMKLDAGSGRPGETGAYLKPAGLQARKGAVYAVIGHGCQISGGTLNHPAMYRSLNVLGSLVLDIQGPRLDVRMLRSDGVIDDSFTLLKNNALYDTDGDGIPDAYERANGLNPNDSSDAAQDADGDGFTNLAEYRAGTDPRDPADSLRVTEIARTGDSVTLQFRTVLGRTYRVEWSTDLAAGPWTTLPGTLAGTGTPVTVVDSGANGAKRFYRAIHTP